MQAIIDGATLAKVNSVREELFIIKCEHIILASTGNSKMY